MAVNTETSNAIWYKMLDSGRLGRYYGPLADRYRKREWVVRFILLASVMGSITTLIAAMHPMAQRLVGGVVGIAVIAEMVLRTSQTAAALGFLRDECDQTKMALEELWSDLSIIEDGEARRRLRALSNHLQHVRALDEVPADEAVNESSARAAYKELEERYGNSAKPAPTGERSATLASTATHAVATHAAAS